MEDEDLLDDERPAWHVRLRTWVFRHPKDAVALLVAMIGCGTIATNALFMQTGPHPAPLFKLHALIKPSPARAHADVTPRPRPAAPETTASAAPTAAPPQRPRAELIADIQRALAKRGAYSGTIDGIYGPKTEAAVRSYAQHAHIQLGDEPSEALLESIARPTTQSAHKATVAMPSRTHDDAIADLLAPSRRVLAVQRVLSDYGYGQLKPTGVLGPDTIAAIEKFERARQLPVTGHVGDRLMQELAVVTGHAIE